MLLDRASGAVHDTFGVTWFARWLQESYSQRVKRPLSFVQEEFNSVRRPVLLNCLDVLYGHCLLKLLNAQYYIDHRPDLDLVLLVPRILRWMVPDGAAQVWSVDLPLDRGTEWNDWLASEIRGRLEKYDECWLSRAFSHPHPDDYAIERFTRIKPFPIDEWESRLSKPQLTFIWREDRSWASMRPRRRPGAIFRRVTGKPYGLDEQRDNVILLAETLVDQFTEIDFAIAGIGSPGGFPAWIHEMRSSTITEEQELEWCRRYANSHVVIGVHGSNMLLPSAHAGAVVELMPFERWGNMLQDTLLRPYDCREALYRYRFVPISTSPDSLAPVVLSLLRDHSSMLLTMRREFCDHERMKQAEFWGDAAQHKPRGLPVG
jgi:hypothetical protein